MTGRGGTQQALRRPGRADGTAGGLPPLSETYGVSSAPLSVAGPSVRPAPARAHTTPETKRRRPSATSVRRQIPSSLRPSLRNALTIPSFWGAASPYLPDTPSISGGVR